MIGKHIWIRLLCVAGVIMLLPAGLRPAETVSAAEETAVSAGEPASAAEQTAVSAREPAEEREQTAAAAQDAAALQDGAAESGWLDPLEATAALQITDFPVRTEFYAAGVAESTVKELGIDGSSVPPGKLADAADRLSRSMTERQKELIRSDGMTIRGLSFGRMYLITGRAVQTEEGLVTPLPFLVRPSEEQRLIRAEAKYTVEKTPSSGPEKKETAADSGTKSGTGGTGQKKGAVSVTLKKKNGNVSLEPVQTGDIDLKELAVTILSAFILGLAVIIRKRIK